MRSWPALVVSGFGPQAASDLVEATLIDFGVLALEELDDQAWRVYFSDAANRAAAQSALIAQFPLLSVQPIDIPDEDWAARSQASLTHVQVGGVIVAPPWDLPIEAQGSRHKAQGSTTVVIQPSMGFGTGHHATTRLCLAALQDMDLAGRRVIDVGTGSGVLAIAASLLGAARVVGIDDDPDAIQAARENLQLNQSARVSFDVVDLRKSALEPADVVLANLTGGLLVSAAATLTALVRLGGTLVISGLMQDEEQAVRAAFTDLRTEQRAREDEWLCLRMVR